MSLVTYPLNGIEYTAEDAELYNAVRTSGVFHSDDFVASAAGQGNLVAVSPGIGWIKNTKFSGKVIALRDEDFVELPIAHESLDRIDAVLLRFDAAENSTKLTYRTGSPSSDPIEPEIERNESVYELHLCHVYRKAGAQFVGDEDITDVRGEPAYCGFVSNGISDYVLSLTGGKMHGNINMDSNRIKNVAEPVDPGDVVSKRYADKIAEKIISTGARLESWKVSLAARQTAEHTFSDKVQAVLVGLQLKNGGTANSVIWGENMSGLTQTCYGEMGDTVGAWKTRVDFDGNKIKIYRDGTSAVTYYITAILPSAPSLSVTDDGQGNVTIV